ncbi:MAG: TIGR04211 family SH3 domain-containing protein [Halieaceae bacterium]|nr:TIGR04211 family SH3 domain-containing protein [Halieaceae bacterium]
MTSVQRIMALCATALTLCSVLANAEIQYISDKHFVPLRSGPGGQFRIVHRGLPSGTQLEIIQLSEDTEFAEVTTQNGTLGWIRTQYLMDEPPARAVLESMQGSQAELKTRMQSLQNEVDRLRTEKESAVAAMNQAQTDLAETREALDKLRSLSEDAINIETRNQALSQRVEELTADFEVTQAENQRLQERMEHNQFMDGALAVGLGVLIALLVPRLWPQRRRSSGWV